jgi:LAS superfamily LD-carboxypeptidase LdcB
MKRIAYFWIAAILIIAAASLASAQTPTAQPQSLGDYARTVRKDKEKKPSSGKVFDNENLPVDDKLSVVGGAAASGDQQPAPGVEPTANQTADAKPAAIQPGESPEDRQKTYDAWKDKIAAQKAKMDLAARELDVQQREYQLRAAAMYADAGNRLRSSGTWDKEDADYKKKIEEKKKAADEAKEQLENMQEDARKAGVPTSVREEQ